MKPSVFLDSGIFIAFMSLRDRWHAQAVEMFARPTPKWHTSVAVFAETYTWFLHRHGEESARTFRRFVDELDGLRMLTVSAKDHEAVLAVLDLYRGCKLTYVDAASLMLMKRHKIGEVWGTDHHLSLAGARVFPRS